MFPKQNATRVSLGITLAIVLCGIRGSLVAWKKPEGSKLQVASTAVQQHNVHGPQFFAELLCQSESELGDCDLALMNLLCVQGLSGDARIDVQGFLEMLEQWAGRVKSETERHLYRFHQNPREFHSSDGFFRLLMMAVVLAEDFQVHYNPARVSSPYQVSARDGFFADSRDVFLHGLLGPNRMGTCSSMPVLYVALGRRLGYPLKLVTTKGHLFVRWEDTKERFNVETTGRGIEKFDDEYYKRWPFPVTEEEIQANGYLESLTPSGELAVFLSIRAMCLREAGRKEEARESFAAAVRFAPGCREYRLMLAQLSNSVAPSKVVGQEPIMQIPHEIRVSHSRR